MTAGPTCRVLFLLPLVAGLVFAALAPVHAQQESVALIISGVDYAALDAVLVQFTQRTGIAVEVTRSTSWVDHRERVATMAAAGVVPDVLYCEGGSFNFFLMNNLVLALDPYVARDVDISRFPASVLPFWQADGKLYGMPTALSLHNAYFNVDHYEQAGVAPPPVDWESNAWGWNEFVEAMRKLTRDANGDGTPDQYGLDSFGWGGGINHLGLWGLWMVDEAVTEYYGDSPEVIAALERFVGLWTEHGVVGGNFAQGTASTSIVQSFIVNTLAAAGNQIRWGVGAMPMGTQRASQTGYHGVCVAREARNPDGAWELVKFLTYDPEGAVAFARAENRVPVLGITARDYIERFSNVISEAMLGSITGAVDYIYNTRYGRHPRGNDMFNAWVPLHGPMTRGEISVREAMEQIAPTIRAMIADR